MIKGLNLRPFINQHKGSQVETLYENKSVFKQKSLYMLMLQKNKKRIYINPLLFRDRNRKLALLHDKGILYKIILYIIENTWFR